MASSLCHSSSVINVFVLRVTVLDITEMKAPEQHQTNDWVYVISVVWSDMRENKIYRRYSEVSALYNLIYKLRYSAKLTTSKKWPNLPKVPVRGFFNWSTIKWMVRNQAKVDLFMKVLINYPAQISRHKSVLDFFEICEADHFYHILKQHSQEKESGLEANQRQVRTVVGKLTNRSCSDTEDNQGEVSSRPKTPNFLPVTSCFEPDDEIYDDKNGYQNLLEDITSLNLYEDYDDLYRIPLKKLVNLHNNFNTYSAAAKLRTSEDEQWIRECEEIISPYSPNKAYFRLVQDFESDFA